MENGYQHNTGTTFTGSVTQVTDYYPFGMAYEAPATNPYLYNGKELQTHLELNWYDYGARMYDAQVARWWVHDPMAEKYISISPYVYCANNPIIFIDPNGMEITGDTAAVRHLENRAKHNVTREQRKQERMRARAERRSAKGKRTNGLQRRMARSEFRENQFQSTIDELGEMRNSNVIYEVNTNYVSEDSDGSTEYNGKVSENGNYIIEINVSQSYLSEGGLAHELAHGYQFETGQLDFFDDGSAGYLYDITDEVKAFIRQFAFTGNSRMYNVSAEYVRNLTNSKGKRPYENLPNGPLDINSSKAKIYLNSGRRFDLPSAPFTNLNSDSIYNK